MLLLVSPRGPASLHCLPRLCVTCMWQRWRLCWQHPQAVPCGSPNTGCTTTPTACCTVRAAAFGTFICIIHLPYGTAKVPCISSVTTLSICCRSHLLLLLPLLPPPLPLLPLLPLPLLPPPLPLLPVLPLPPLLPLLQLP
jgi:hypothetical protein